MQLINPSSLPTNGSSIQPGINNMSGTNVSNPNILVPLQVNYVNHNNSHMNNNHNGHGHMMNPNMMQPNFQNKMNPFISNRFPSQQHQHIQPIQTQQNMMQQQQQQQRKIGMFPDQPNQITDPNQQQPISIVGSNL